MLDPHQNWSSYSFQHFYGGLGIFHCFPGCRNVLLVQCHTPILADQLVIHQQCQLFLPLLAGQFQRQPQCLNELR